MDRGRVERVGRGRGARGGGEGAAVSKSTPGPFRYTVQSQCDSTTVYDRGEFCKSFAAGAPVVLFWLGVVAVSSHLGGGVKKRKHVPDTYYDGKRPT